uniref:Uncharacterized protein n=1 Tax=viral metagenome TaxID=1070528 RepID=A0A6M3IFZ9_9ZZZZ
MFIWIMRAFRVMGILATDLPKAFEDGKLTIQEIVDLMLKIAAVFGFDNIIVEIPPELRNTDVAMKIDGFSGGYPHA